jgi:hypothetical protein
MTEGLQAMNHYGFQTLMSDARATILNLSRRELELGGDAMELELNLRSASLSDSGEMFMERSGFERFLNKTNELFFVANGLNFANQIDKHWGGLILMANMNERLMGHHLGDVPMDPTLAARYAATGIDQAMGKRIAGELEQHGIRFKNLTLANTEAWTDRLAADTYSKSIVAQVNRVVPTPGAGDRPLFMSSELGSLLTQYKAFGMGATTRILYAGLQEEGAKFWLGASVMVGGALLLNEMRSRLFSNQSTADRPMTAMVADAIDRSSVMGIFSDANRAVEMLSGHRLGVRPMLGGESAHGEGWGRQVGSVAGPFAGQVANAASVVDDTFFNHPVAATFRNARQLVPGQNLPYIDPIADRAVSIARHMMLRPPGQED